MNSTETQNTIFSENNYICIATKNKIYNSDSWSIWILTTIKTSISARKKTLSIMRGIFHWTHTISNDKWCTNCINVTTKNTIRNIIQYLYAMWFHQKLKWKRTALEFKRNNTSIYSHHSSFPSAFSTNILIKFNANHSIYWNLEMVYFASCMIHFYF